MRYLYVVIAALLGAMVVLFVLQNASTATVSLLSARVTLPIALLVGGAYVLGMLTGGFVLAFVRGVARRARAAEPRP